MRKSAPLFVSVVVLVCLAISAPAAGAILEVDCTFGPFFTIQSAVDVAVDGDTIVVHACTYLESVTIDGLNRVSLIVADAAASVTGSYPTGVGALPAPLVTVDSTGTSGPCFEITGGSSRITISGFQIANCDTDGIFSDVARDNAFHGNRIQGCTFLGINDTGSSTKITSNAIGLNGSGGIGLGNAFFAYVADNRIAFNGDAGMRVFGDFIHLVNNEVIGNAMEGMFIEGTENRVERNFYSGNGGVANLVFGPFSTDADATGNDTDGSLVDLGVGTEELDNI